jgi:hypothetical protein
MSSVIESLHEIYEMAKELKLKVDVSGEVDHSENESLFESIKAFGEAVVQLKDPFDIEFDFLDLFDKCKQAAGVETIEDLSNVWGFNIDEDELPSYILSLCPDAVAADNMLEGVKLVLASSSILGEKSQKKFVAELGLLLERFHVIHADKFEELHALN